jgi:hypothetical protein
MSIGHFNVLRALEFFEQISAADDFDDNLVELPANRGLEGRLARSLG